MAGTLLGEIDSATLELTDTEPGVTVGHRVERGVLSGLLSMPPHARVLSDIDDPLEGCDLAVKSITFGRVGDPAGTHTRERNLGVTMRAFGYIPKWPSGWMGSAQWVRPDGEEEGREDDAL
jgi:hypothetical protein